MPKKKNKRTPRPRTSGRWMGPLPASAGCDCMICRPETHFSGQERRTVDTVLQHGWQVLMVSDTGCDHPDHEDHEDDDVLGDLGISDPSPAFAYTVGLGHRCAHPELLMSGLDVHLMHSVLNQLAAQVLAGRRLAAGDVLEGVLKGVPVVLEQVSDEALGETVPWSGWFHRRRPEALMIVWPSTSGLFPWQPGAPAVLDEAQPRWWRDPIEHCTGVGVDPEWLLPVPPDHPAFSCTHVVDSGAPPLWAARQTTGGRGEDWTIHCGGFDHPVDDMRVVHIAHLVRAAPRLRELNTLALDTQALRADPDAPWQTAPLPEQARHS